MRHIMILLAFTLLNSLVFAARVELFNGKVIWGHTMTKDGLISVDSERGLFQFHLNQVKSVKGGRKEWIAIGDFIELRKEASQTSDIHFRLYPGTSVRRQKGDTDDFRKVKVYDTIGYLALKSAGSEFVQSAPVNPQIEMTLNDGVVKMELFEDTAPNTVANFIQLTQKNFYNGLNFHRVDEKFLVMGGDPQGTGEGGPGYRIKSEISPGVKNIMGYLGMADKGVDTAGSQFYILLADAPHLDGRYTLFGKVTSGMKLVQKIKVGDEILEMKVVKKRKHPYRPEKLPAIEKP